MRTCIYGNAGAESHEAASQAHDSPALFAEVQRREVKEKVAVGRQSSQVAHRRRTGRAAHDCRRDARGNPARLSGRTILIQDQKSVVCHLWAHTHLPRLQVRGAWSPVGSSAEPWLMSVLRRGDEKIHYSDNSHRWIAPTDDEQEMWTEMVWAHVSDHRGWRNAPTTDQERKTSTSRGARPTTP
jgi:hypothetical protein